MEVGFAFSLEHLNEKFFSEFCEYCRHLLHIKAYPACFSYFMYNVCFIWLLPSQKFVQTFLNQRVYFEVQGDYDRTWNFWKYFLEILQSRSVPSFLYPRNFSFPLSFDVMVYFRASIAVNLSHAMVTST